MKKKLKPGRRSGAGRVRLGALLCLQAMARADSRALHPHWTSLLPVQQPLQPRPLLPHLLTVLLYDPQPKVRQNGFRAELSELVHPLSRFRIFDRLY